MNLCARQRRCCRVFDNFTFHEILLVFSEWMVHRQELSMQVKAGILSTRRQPMKLKSCFALWAGEPSMHTPGNEKRKCRQIMQRVLVPNIQLKVLFLSCVVCVDPIHPSFFQVIHQRLHVHTHILPRIVWPWNYQRQKYVLFLHNGRWWKIERNNKHRPATILGSRHTKRIEPIETDGDSAIPWLFSFFHMFSIKCLPCITIRRVYQHRISVFI